MDLKSIFIDRLVDTTKYDNQRDYVNSAASAGQKNVAVSNGGNFFAGEEVIIYNGEDTFESAVIDSIATNTLTMTENLANAYPEGSYIGKYLGFLDTASGEYEKISSPDLGTGADGAFTSSGNATWTTDKNFTSITIVSGHIITIQGNVNIKCQGDITITSGKITAKGQGHAGGASGRYRGVQGVSYAGVPTTDYVANYGGGGGGYALSSPSDTSLGGGGGGAYGAVGTKGEYRVTATHGGDGGAVYNTAQLSTFTEAYLKGSGGGGGGHYDNNYLGGAGGNGGGIIKLHCKNLSVHATNGEIDCDGENGGNGIPNAGATYGNTGGGGGAGGTIYIQVLNKCSIGTSKVHSNGGVGGAGSWSNAMRTDLDGGNGGIGRIRIEAGKIIGTSAPTYTYGYNTNVGGYVRYGWYHTIRIEPTSIKTLVQCSIKQNNTALIQTVASGASSGQHNIAVTSGATFQSGDVCVIYEAGVGYELQTIDSISTNTLIMAGHLTNSYTTNAKVFPIRCQAYASMQPAGTDEDQEQLGLVDVFDCGSNLWNINFQGIFKTTNDSIDRSLIVGRVKIWSKDNDTTDINIKEVDWFYY